MKYDVVIIGSGLGGLQCGYLLAKKGYDVCILEKNHQVGGCIQSFRRGNATFDTGFHHVGSMGKNEVLYDLLAPFNLTHLPWHQLDTDACDEICIDGKSYLMANGYNAYAERLTSYFPAQRQEIQTYTGFLKQENEALQHGIRHDLNSIFQQGALIEQSAHDYLRQAFSEPLLRDVLSGTSMKMELKADSLPLYIFAQLNSSYVPSTWRLRGGGGLIAESLCNDLRAMGATLRVDTPALRMEVSEKWVTKVFIGKDEFVEGRCVIADIHPAAVLRLLPQDSVRKSFRNRIENLENGHGIFTANIRLKQGTVPYLNRNLYIHQHADLWNVSQNGIHSALVSFSVPENGETTTRNIDILTRMTWDEVAPWMGTQSGHRGSGYQEMKQRKCEQLIDFVSQRLPEIKGNIEAVYTSTPLTYADYIATENGAAYGIRKDCRQWLYTVLLPVTPLYNLFFTGQNVNFHGILGVSITALQTTTMAEKMLQVSRF